MNPPQCVPMLLLYHLRTPLFVLMARENSPKQALSWQRLVTVLRSLSTGIEMVEMPASIIIWILLLLLCDAQVESKGKDGKRTLTPVRRWVVLIILYAIVVAIRRLCYGLSFVRYLGWRYLWITLVSCFTTSATLNCLAYYVAYSSRSRRISVSALEPTPSPLRKEMEAML